MKRVTQTISVDIPVTARIDAIARKDDYGVPGSPVWWDIEPSDWSDVAIEICGVMVPVKSLPVELRSAIWDAVCDDADEWKWEGCDG